LRIAKRKIAQYYSLLERFKVFVSMTATNEDGEEFELSDAPLRARDEQLNIPKIRLGAAKHDVHPIRNTSIRGVV
jgi:hypothetical protein